MVRCNTVKVNPIRVEIIKGIKMVRLVQILLLICAFNLSLGPSLAQAFHGSQDSEVAKQTDPCTDEDDDCEKTSVQEGSPAENSVPETSIVRVSQKNDCSDDCNGPNCPPGLNCRSGSCLFTLANSIHLHAPTVTLKVREILFSFIGVILSPPTKPPIALV